MTVYLARLLKTYDFHSIQDFALSLAPSFKYRIEVLLLATSIVWVPIDKWFGIDDTAFVALVLVFAMELITGIAASLMRKETFSSLKLSRFGLKATCYLVLIFTSYSMYASFKSHHQDTASIIFDWLHIFLVVQIVFENIISVLENLAVLSGEDKSAWIVKIKNKVDSIFG